MFRFSSTSKSRLEGVNPALVTVTERALALSPIDFGIAWMGGYRTAKDQYKLYMAGSSKADGYESKSAHQTGKAIDTYAWVDGKYTQEMEHLSIIAAAHLQAGHELDIPVGWGGLWKSIVDGPHIYLLENK